MLGIYSESFSEKAKMSAVSTSCCNRYGLLVGRPSSRQWQMTQCCIDLVDELVLHKMDSGEIIIICILYAIL